MTAADLAKLRRLWADCEPLLRTWHGWSDEDCATSVAAIKAGIEAGDDALLQCWSAWLAEQAEPLREKVRAAEGRIRKAEREKRERQAA